MKNFLIFISKHLNIFQRLTFFLSMLSLTIMTTVCMPVMGWSTTLKYALDIDVDTVEKIITGVARLDSDTGETIELSVKHLTGLKIDNSEIVNDKETIRLTLSKDRQTAISYEAHLSDSKINVIEKDHIFLNRAWYPEPDILAVYNFSVTLPIDFIAVSEADKVTINKEGGMKSFVFDFKHPLDALHLAASTRYVVKRDRFGDIDIETYFFGKEDTFSATYIAYTKKYLEMYQKILPRFPFKRFAVVENIFPSGNSMPTFTLLGSQVIKLPFIPETSLGHEILHQWFGNSVYVDFAHGNWAEGLTTYLADHHYAELKGEDRTYRKQIMIDYDAYVNPENAISMDRFSIRRNKAESTVGYGKSAMMFHWLKKRYGERVFLTALNDFIVQNRFRRASWHDVQRAFEKAAGETLYKEFGWWLTEKDIVGFSAEKVDLLVDQGQLKLNLRLKGGRERFPFQIPISLYFGSVKELRRIDLKDTLERISLPLEAVPTSVIIDEDYSVMRRLSPEEIPPVLASVMGKKKLIAVFDPEQRAMYQPIIDALGVKNIIHMGPDDIAFTRLKENSILAARNENAFADMLFGKQDIPKAGVHLQIHKNPYNLKERIALLHVEDLKEAKAVKRKLRHYGKYTELAFEGGVNTLKTIKKATDGIPVLTRPGQRVLDPKGMLTLEDLLPDLKESRVIYIGERHDRFSHHMNQLQFIKRLREKGEKIAVGMEMFRRPCQHVLDDYMAGRIDERTFLKKSAYFKNWGYDYHLYKPIVDYLKKHGIPMVALNIDMDINRKVAREGIYSLKGDQRNHLPTEMKFSNQQYRRDLYEIFVSHREHSEIDDFDYFLQAQTLWDEAMAETAHQYLLGNPDQKLLILAGNGHVRHRYGIPERLFRRNQKKYTIIVQDEEVEDGIADYVLKTRHLKGVGSVKLGVSIEAKGRGLLVKGVGKNSPAQTAGLQKGDIIRHFANQQIASLSDLKLALFYTKRGSASEIQFERKGKTFNKKIEF